METFNMLLLIIGYMVGGMPGVGVAAIIILVLN